MSSRVSIVIPTYRRERVLVDTIGHLLALASRADEILIVDQTPIHETGVAEALGAWEGAGAIRWVRQSLPSIPKAMNRGLLEAHSDVVLFLDDDIAPHPHLVAAHRRAHREAGAHLVAGRVLQPWNDEQEVGDWGRLGFAATTARRVDQFMGGNFSVRRHLALDLGGFDENFVGAAYQFEREFADRWIYGGRSILFEPRAVIRHLKASVGGTRSFGSHLTTLGPGHAVGAYYYLLRARRARNRLRRILGRPIRSVTTRHHLRKPWWIPVTLAAELTGLGYALLLAARGTRYASRPVR